MLHLLAQAASNAPKAASYPKVAPLPGSSWMPNQGSTFASEVDTTFYFIYWISVFFFALICLLLVYFLVRYRRRQEGEQAPGRTTHNNALELTWTIIPLLLVIVMFYLGFRGFMDVLNAPANAMEIYVQGSKWSWNFTYPQGPGADAVQSDELHVPVGQPVKLTLFSNDVIHSFFIPAFRIKRDAVPGRFNKIWFQAKYPGEYLALCAEYCGTDHSDMLAKVVVHEPGMYEKWLIEAADPFKGGTVPLATVGRNIVTKKCQSCHTTDGSAFTGPSFKGIFGRQTPIKGGPALTADENYIRESILAPAAKVHEGYEPVMPTFKGQLSDKQILAIIEYMKELSGIAPSAIPAATQPAATSQPATTQPAP